MNIIQTLEQEEIARLTAGKKIPEFRAGDTVNVLVNVIEGSRKRTQAYEGVVIAKRNRGLNSSFIVRKISSGEGVERTFQLYSPMIASIEVKRRGDVCRAKFKALTGKDPLELKYPMEDQSWLNFRYDAITNVVKTITARLKTEGKTLTAAVFPGPTMAKRMVRQDWGNWPLDAYFPMIYNGFYYEGPEWIGRSVAESVKAVGGRAHIYAGLMFPDIKGDDFEKALDIYRYCSGKIRCSFGIGTNLTNDTGYKPSNIVMKLSRCKMNANQEWRECVKLSDDMGKHMGSISEVEACLHELRIEND